MAKYLIRLFIIAALLLAFWYFSTFKYLGVPINFQIATPTKAEDTTYWIIDAAGDTIATETITFYRATPHYYYEITQFPFNKKFLSKGLRVITDTTNKVVWTSYEHFYQSKSSVTQVDTTTRKAVYSTYQEGVMKNRQFLLTRWIPEIDNDSLPKSYFPNFETRSVLNIWWNFSSPSLLTNFVTIDTTQFLPLYSIRTNIKQQNEKELYLISQANDTLYHIKTTGKNVAYIKDFKNQITYSKKSGFIYSYNEIDKAKIMKGL